MSNQCQIPKSIDSPPSPPCSKGGGGGWGNCLKERDYLKHAFGDSHDDENANEGAGHHEKRSLVPPFFHKETDNACRKDSKTPNRKGREKDKAHIPKGYHL